LRRVGDDPRLEGADGVAGGAVPVRLVQRGGPPVCPTAGPVPSRPRAAVAGEAGYDLLGCYHGGATMAVGRMGFYNPRSSHGLSKTQPLIPDHATLCPGTGGITSLKRAEVKLSADSVNPS